VFEIELAAPRGFCAGVVRAIDIVERALELFGAPVYVRHEIVHNRHVVEGLRGRGVVFVESLAEVPAGAIAIFSAHGVARTLYAEAEQRGLRLFDATCPLVTKVHLEVARHAREGREVVLIGHAGHPEVEGTLGHYDRGAGGEIHLVETVADVARLAPRAPERLAYSTQTTLSVEETAGIIAALKARFPSIEGPRKDDICYATQNRQDAVRSLAERCGLMLVIGSKNSSNSNRLRELAEQCGAESRLIDDARDLDPEWLRGVHRVGVTAGASAPEHLVRGLVQRLEALGGRLASDPEQSTEAVFFPLPTALRPQGGTT